MEDFINNLNSKKRDSSYKSIPYGGDVNAWTSATATNFTFLPQLIGTRAYRFSKKNILKHWRKDSLSLYLLQILPLKALSEGFHFADPDDEDEEPLPVWEPYEADWKKKGEEAFYKTVAGERAFGLSAMHYDNRKDKFQVIYGNQINRLEADAFDDITAMTVQRKNQSIPLNMNYVRYFRRDFPQDPWGYSYLEPIWDKIVYIYWITFSMAEAAAAEGSKFLTIGVKDAQKGTINRIASYVPGISARKAFIHSLRQVASEDIKVHDTKLNATFSDYLDACYRQVALYTCIPESILTGLRQGAYLGATVDVGTEYEALSMIQREVEPFLRDILANEPFWFDNEDYKLVWHKKARLTDKEKAELEYLKAQTNQIKLSWMERKEIRDIYGLRPLPKGSEEFAQTIQMQFQRTPQAARGVP